ncbi:hypothetical protein [Terasakiella sp. SH-1]|uniref:hypothetical protein n=1 Tax=Terasakiella sp. SH-1 TaxID=2560057 RepID=UPI0010733299|nr:hypothetical protein [Terasakiella sp. SH-1]
MKKLSFIVLVFISACTSEPETNLLSESAYLQSAERHIYEIRNIPHATTQLHKALSIHNSADAAALLAQLKIAQTQLTDRDESWREEVTTLVSPFKKTNAQAAYLYALVQQKQPNQTQVLNNFLNAAALKSAAAMLYVGSIYHHDFDDPKTAYDFTLRALKHGCPAALGFLKAYQNRFISKEELIELTLFAAIEGSVSARWDMSLYLDAINPVEALYWERQADKAHKERIRRSKLPLYDLNAVCMN